MHELISKSDVLLEALPYLQKYRGAIFVIKYGGSFMDAPDPETRTAVARDVVLLAALGLKPVLVHGGGKAITAALTKSGLTAKFVQGMRVTDAPTVKIVERVLSREINPEIVGTIKNLGAKAKGFSGSKIFSCRKLWLDPAHSPENDLGFVGEVMKTATQPILQCLRAGFIPVISPTARGVDGKIYNCNADVAAAAAAMALHAQRMVFLSDVPGLLRDPKNADSLISVLRAGEVDSLKKSGIIDRGMIPKVDSAVAARRKGVDKVSFLDGRVRHAALLEIFSDEPIGTQIVL